MAQVYEMVRIDELIESEQWGEALRSIVRTSELSSDEKSEILELIEAVRKDAYEAGRKS